MLGNQKSVDFGRLLANFLIAGSVFLWPVENVFAAADLTTSSADFTAADSARNIPAVVTPYMDRDGGLGWRE